MADVIDLDAYDNSNIATTPFFLKESDVTPSSFITGEDLARTIRIQDTLKQPIELKALSYNPQTKVFQGVESAATAFIDGISDLTPSVKNLLGQLALQMFDSKPINADFMEKIKKSGVEIPGITNRDDPDYQKTIELLNGVSYPIRKIATRVIANTTDTVENRRMLRALYDQAHGIDPSKWYNIIPRLLGNSAIIFPAAKGVTFASRLLGGSRVSAIKNAERIARGIVFAEEGGAYATETAAQYLARTGDKNFENFTPQDATGLSALAVGIINQKIEFMGGLEPILAGAINKVGLRSSLLKAGVKIGAGEYGEEVGQAITELIARKIDGTSDKTWKDGMTEALVNSLWAIPGGAVVGTVGFQRNRANLVKGIRATLPNITEQQATAVADAMIDSTIDSVVPNQSLRNNLREKVSYMYKNIDLDNKEDRIDAITDLEYALATMDATDRGIDLTEHEIFQGEVTPIGWFRAGIPEAQRTDIQAIIDNITDLQTQLETLNKAKEKDWAKIEEIENKLAQANQYVLDKLSDLISKESFTRTLENLEKKYVAKQKKKAKIPVDTLETYSPDKRNIYFQTNVYDGLTTTDSVMAVINTIQRISNGNAERMLYDKNNKTWYLADADEITHIDMFGKAFEQGNYPEFNNKRETEQFFNENYMADEQRLLSFLAQKFDTPEIAKKVMERTLGSDEYKHAYLRDNMVIYTRYEEDFSESGLPVESFDHYKVDYDENDNKQVVLVDKAKTNTLFQNRVSGAAPSTYRGAYIPQFRFIQRANKMDASTLSHEMAHDWFETNFYRYRNEKMSKDFMKAWGALEKALGVTEKDNVPPRKASEAFARAYEAWITSNEDWHKLINVDDKDKDAVAKLMQDYQNSLRDIYNDISNPYFKETWGKLGELKPELKAWFDRVVNITDLDVLVERGEMTEEQATNEKLNRAIDTVIENTTDEETAQTLKEVRTLNDTQRYEVEGGNKNSIQQRLSALAKEIDENNMISKGDKYDTRRDMMAVAEAADNFVKTRLDDALAIINGQMAEVEGLFKEDLYTALERLAIENGDLGLIDELKNSEIANRLAKELGQRVAGFRNFKQSTDLDVVSALKSLDNKFNEALKNKKAKQEYESALKSLEESIKQQDKVADKELDSFLKDLECK